MKRTIKIFGFTMLTILFLTLAVLIAHIVLISKDKNVSTEFQLSTNDLHTTTCSTDAYEPEMRE